MQRILNLNHIAGPALLAIAGIGLGLPGLLYAIMWGLRGVGSAVPPVLNSVARGCMWAGAALLGLFVLLVLVEQVQDHYLYHRYRRELGRRVAGRAGATECPFCGCRNVKEWQHFCPVCGKELE